MNINSIFYFPSHFFSSFLPKVNPFLTFKSQHIWSKAIVPSFYNAPPLFFLKEKKHWFSCWPNNSGSPLSGHVNFLAPLWLDEALGLVLTNELGLEMRPEHFLLTWDPPLVFLLPWQLATFQIVTSGSVWPQRMIKWEQSSHLMRWTYSVNEK